MILLLSRRIGEASTEMVSDWLDCLGGRFFRLNVEDLQYPSSFWYEPTGDGVLHLIDGATGAERELRLGDVRVVWYRRWSYFSKYNQDHVPAVYAEPHKQYGLSEYLSREMTAVGQAVFAGLRHAHWLSDAYSSKTDKFRMLSCAREVGLDVPETIVASSRDALAAFASRHERVITKALGLAGYNATTGNGAVAAYTATVSDELLADAPGVFFPSLVQEAVDKRYELRCFVLGSEVYSMAIFSQQDAQTAMDFRHYNDARPNRNVPYRLPEEVRGKILRLFRELGLDTGSADLIRTTDGRYVFLEINPIGQFGMVSLPCNYGLEEKVAAYLMNHDQA